MNSNPILDELYRVRTELLAEHHGDLGAYLAAAAERAKQSSHPIAVISQRSIREGWKPHLPDRLAVRESMPDSESH
jgi:hypothetical protein